MCDFSGNWVAWLDGELSFEEAERARVHLEGCSECRSRVNAYRQVTLELDAACDEGMASGARPHLRRWTAMISATSAIAAVVALLILMPRAPVRHPIAASDEGLAPIPTASPRAEQLPLTARRVEKTRRAGSATAPLQVRNLSRLPNQGENEYAPPNEPVIEISIPAEEMFPPGAVPAGMGFAADLAIAADGSPDRLRLQPRLAGFQRRTSIP